ncbi:MAG: M20/M25/M40 family metallo-hydrolase [Eubacterium sp.]|nr:M20/M25/M40 family metallo-hydrolase [Eubacterium sp.]
MNSVNEKRIIDLFKRLVETDSPSRGERQVCDLVKKELEKLGIEPIEDSAGEKIGGNAGNIYAYIDGDIDLPPILFSAHMDTVEPSSNKKMIIDEDGRIHSDGTTVLGSDDFAGITSIIEALAVIRENKLSHRPIELLFSVCEEQCGGGADVADYDKIKSKEAYVFDLDGSAGTACYAAPTILTFKAEFKGRAAHAGLDPENGIHAIRAASLAISRIECGKIDGTTVNIGTLKGGVANNIVPEHCVFTGEIRSYDDEKVTERYELIEDIIRRSAEEFGASVETESFRGIIAYETDLEHPVVQRFTNACDAMKIESKLERSFGGSDNNVFALYGIKGLVLSTAMNDCHTTNEWTTVNDLKGAAELALTLMLSKE